MTKNIVLDTLKNMPLNFDVDELIEKLIVLEKIEKAQKSLSEGKGVSHDEIIKQMANHINLRKNESNNLGSGSI